MKKLFFMSFIFVVLCGFLSSQIVVTSPNGGENWAKTTTHNVIWNTGGVAGNVIIQLMQGGTSQGAIYNGSNSGTFSWEIDNYLSGAAIAVGAYRLQVKSLSDTSIKDQSNTNFNVTAAPSSRGSITVTDPNGGESWVKGSAHDVTWDSSGVSGNVIIQLMQGGVSQGAIYNGANTGSYNWTINNYLNGTPIAVGNYRLQVKSLNNTSVLDQSNSEFAISSGTTFVFTPMVATLFKPHSIKVVEPNGGRDLALNSRIRILWKPKNLTNNVRISLMKDGELFGIIANDLAPGRISYEWTIGKTLSEIALPGSGYKIKVEEQGVSISDQSDRSFSILQEKHVDLSCYISGHRSADYGRKVVLTVKVRVNNIGREVLRDVPVRVAVKIVGASSGETQTKTIPEVTYRGHSYEYSLNFTFRLHGGSRYADRRLMDREAIVVVDPDDIFRDRRRINNTSTYNFSF